MKPLDIKSLLNEICPPLEEQLCEQLIKEFLSLEKRYILHDWEPATLDGGQFAEAAARILYHQDSNNLNQRKSVNKCISYVEDSSNSNEHNYPDRKSALHTAKVLKTIYKFRSDRGAVHIDPDYSANQLDSKLVLENARWALSEILRVFWNGNREIIAKTIRGLLQFEVPIVAEFSGKLLVQRTDCSIEEEVVILLHYVGETGLSRKELGNFVQASPSSITNALKKLSSRNFRRVIRISSGNYRLTDPGIKYVLSEISNKLAM